MIAICSLLLIVAHSSCDDNELSITTGNVTFSVSSNTVVHDNTNGRLAEISIPAFILISVEDEQGKRMETDKKMPLYRFGERYMTEGLELTSGNYKLTQFLVLDSTNIVIYATPLGGSDLAQYANDPLPNYFSIVENVGTQVAPQVLAVSADDTPERFGYVSFDFVVVEIPADTNVVDLPVKILYPPNPGSSYDSVYIKFFNSRMLLEKQQRLILDTGTHSAAGVVKDLPIGNWKISIDYFETITAKKKSEIQTGSATATITSSTTNLFSNGLTLSMDNDDQPVEKTMTWEKYFVFYFFDNKALSAIIRLPADPLNPFFGISLVKPSWEYFYADRTFYDARPNEPGSHYVQGSAAFEKYNNTNTSIDYTDTTSFKSVTDIVRNKPWDLADALVIFFIDGVEQPIFYYQWYAGDSNSGRAASVNFSTEQLNTRKQTNLK